MSLSRRTRKAPWLRVRNPGNSRDRYMPIIDSTRMKRIGLAPSLGVASSTGRRTKRTSWLGIGISACMVVPSRSRLSSTPTVMPPLAMNGKGCEGSTAIGVRIGRYCEMNCRSSHSRSWGLSSLGSTMWILASAISALRAIQQAC